MPFWMNLLFLTFLPPLFIALDIFNVCELEEYSAVLEALLIEHIKIIELTDVI